MNRWEKVCSAAGVEQGVVAAAIRESKGAEETALSALLNKASGLAAVDRIDEAAEHLRLAVAMAGQRGRVLGALRAAQAIEDALWGEKGEGLEDDFKLGFVRRFMRENGFGPGAPKGGAK